MKKLTRRSLFGLIAAAFCPKPKLPQPRPRLLFNPPANIASMYKFGKIGDVIHVRRPPRYVVSNARSLELLKLNANAARQSMLSAEARAREEQKADLQFLDYIKV